MPVTVSSKHFDPFGIMDSGQCFRMVPLDTCTVEVIAYGRLLTVTALGGNRFTFGCDQHAFDTLWRGYFDWDTDYGAIAAAAPGEDLFLQRALAYSRGLRILRQEPWETLCGFILSQQKNIRAIRACMEALCDTYGDPIAGTARKTFPTPERLAALTQTDLRQLGLGYRAPYILDAAQKAASGALDLQALAALPDPELHAALRSVHGVGVKVADCVMLFAYGRYARAPVDVWIHRVIREDYGGKSPFEGYGAYAGIYQQYLFILRRDEGRAPHP